MKRILLVIIACISFCFAQSWQTKDVVRIQDVSASLKVVFKDSSFVYLQKCNVSYIVNQSGSTYVQIGYQWDGSTSKIISFPYNSITQPTASGAVSLVQILNSWL
jgi:hypothetical protein